jgi:hypothetical protein
MAEPDPLSAAGVIDVTVPLLSAFRVTVVPLTEDVTPVPPVKVSVPLDVMAEPDPESAAAVRLVTVPLLSALRTPLEALMPVPAMAVARSAIDSFLQSPVAPPSRNRM